MCIRDSSVIRLVDIDPSSPEKGRRFPLALRASSSATTFTLPRTTNLGGGVYAGALMRGAGSSTGYAARARFAADAGSQRLEGHALDLRHHLERPVHVIGPQRRQGEAAVARDDGGDPVDVRRRAVRIPKQLGVVVGVGVDEACLLYTSRCV